MSGRAPYDHGISSTSPSDAAATQQTTSRDESQTQASPSAAVSASRPPGVASFSNLLNPAGHDESSSKRRKATDLDSPPLSARTLNVSKHRQGPESLQLGGELQQRRILTPRSPSLHRAASMGQMNAPRPVSRDVSHGQYTSSSGPRAYKVEPGTAGVPALPTSRGYHPPPSPSVPERRTSTSTTVDSRARSASVSPRTKYAHYAQQSPPASTLLSLPPHAYTDERQRPTGIPISSASNQSVYQMYTLHTSAGAVPIPVDVQAASRVADEKRKRNAGASARFRARRKEKEKESSETIGKLEDEVKQLTEQVEFYRRERGTLANALLQYPGGDRHFPRPPSPKYRAMSLSISSRRESFDYQEPSPGPGEARNVRRRTSTQSLSMGAPQTLPGSSGAAHHYKHQHQHLQHQPLYQHQIQSQTHAPPPGPGLVLPPIHTQVGPTGPPPHHPQQQPQSHPHTPLLTQSPQHALGWTPYNNGSRPPTQQGRPSNPHAR